MSEDCPYCHRKIWWWQRRKAFDSGYMLYHGDCWAELNDDYQRIKAMGRLTRYQKRRIRKERES